MDPSDPFTASIPTPTAARPLLGLTVLVVEDSRYACEAIRLLCLRSGARIRRADSLRSARRHLQVYRPTVVIADLGLPDGNGIELIQELLSATPTVQAVIAMSGDLETEEAALAAGAHGFLAKPLTSLATFQESILALLPAERRPAGPRILSEEEVEPDPIAFQDDIAHIAEVMEDQPNDQALDYVAQFLGGVARAVQDPPLENAAKALARKRSKGESAVSETAVLVGMIQDRLSERIAI